MTPGEEAPLPGVRGQDGLCSFSAPGENSNLNQVVSFFSSYLTGTGSFFGSSCSPFHWAQACQHPSLPSPVLLSQFLTCVQCFVLSKAVSSLMLLDFLKISGR